MIKVMHSSIRVEYIVLLQNKDRHQLLSNCSNRPLEVNTKDGGSGPRAQLPHHQRCLHSNGRQPGAVFRAGWSLRAKQKKLLASVRPSTTVGGEPTAI